MTKKPILTQEQARRRVLELVWRTKVELGLHSPPRYMGVNDPIAAHLGIVVTEEEILPFDEGLYKPGDPPRIVLDSRVRDPDRMNFTFFHEISHHLIRQDAELYSFLDEYVPSNDDFKTALDHYCNIGSAEFLIPEDDVRRVIAEQGFSITLVEHLELRYPASKPAITIQLAQCANHECFVVICEYGRVPQKATQQTQMAGIPQARQPQLYVLYSSCSPALVQKKHKIYRIAKFVPIPKDHVITASFKGRQLVNGRARIPFASGTVWECECEAFFYKSKVYAVFNVSPPLAPSSLQPPLF